MRRMKLLVVGFLHGGGEIQFLDKPLFSTESYLVLASGAVVMVLTSSTAELKSLMFSEEYRPAGLL